MLLRFTNLVATPAPSARFEVTISSLNVGLGEWVGIVGPSGCGKSTLLRTVLGFSKPVSGLIEKSPIFEKVGTIGYVSQANTLFPWLKVARNVCWSARRLSRLQVDEDLVTLLAALGLRDAAQKYPFELSGGMLRRVMLGRALLYSPRLLILDEPLTGLDIFTRNSMIEVLREQRSRTGVSCLAVFHELIDAVRVFDKIYYFRADGTFSPEPFLPDLATGAAQIDYTTKSNQLLELMRTGRKE